MALLLPHDIPLNGPIIAPWYVLRNALLLLYSILLNTLIITRYYTLLLLYNLLLNNLIPTL